MTDGKFLFYLCFSVSYEVSRRFSERLVIISFILISEARPALRLRSVIPSHLLTETSRASLSLLSVPVDFEVMLPGTYVPQVLDLG